MKVTNSALAKLFKDSWVQIRDAFRVLDLFTTTHLKEKYEELGWMWHIDAQMHDLQGEGR